MHRRLLATAVVAACLPGCASLPTLIGAKRYREAVCVVHGEAEHSPDRTALAAAVEADLNPMIEIHALTADEIEARMAKDAPEDLPFARAAFARLLAVRIRTTSRPGTLVALDEAGVYPLLKRGGESITEQIMVRDDLVAFFGEKLAPSRTEAPGVVAKVGAWEQDVERHPLANALTLGAWSALTGPPATPTVVEPTAAERRRAAPITERLLAAFPPTFCSQTPSASCDRVRFYRRPEGAASAPITVQLVFFMTAREDETFFRRARDCRVDERFVVPLPEAPTLEERFAARFPAGLHPLSALRR